MVFSYFFSATVDFRRRDEYGISSKYFKKRSKREKKTLFKVHNSVLIWKGNLVDKGSTLFKIAIIPFGDLLLSSWSTHKVNHVRIRATV